jgi:hypothetical protein
VVQAASQSTMHDSESRTVPRKGEPEELFQRSFQGCGKQSLSCIKDTKTFNLRSRRHTSKLRSRRWKICSESRASGLPLASTRVARPVLSLGLAGKKTCSEPWASRPTFSFGRGQQDLLSEERRRACLWLRPRTARPVERGAPTGLPLASAEGSKTC